MKKLMYLAVAMTAVASVLTGCSNNSSSDSYTYPNALVTVKTAGDGACYLQLDNSTTILPTNVSKNPFGKQVRAFTYLKNIQSLAGSTYTQSAEVAWMDSILTKAAVPVPKDPASVWGYGYGEDPVDILNSWTTVLEDNYLTLAFRAYYNLSGKTHYMNLVYGSNPEDPYEVVFTHDSGESTGVFTYSFDGIVAFDLTKIPGLTSEKSATVTVKYLSGVYGCEKTVKFSYPGNGSSSVNATGDDSYACAKETIR